ncbi:hypothetical protein [Halalkalibacter krulwichiae]|uniref:Uncharacterized protein n=1 Tax=Halalkalibacter krulwichiae TaxID=199441 RepID=A0A1X9MEJ5_9BACI|nr:hypothetical protein [Halalkalibacter krulwichiae]ARK31836.1 hypothetical protein BkAM31D_19460 [Halalkalibacter krulwichiae]
MKSFRTVDSSIDGIIEKVHVQSGEYVHEWQPLFEVKTASGTLRNLEFSFSGVVSRVNVTPGDLVYSNMTLALVEEDSSPCGCD